jgi:hypothetical protein
MNRQKGIVLVSTLALMAGTGILLHWFQTHQKLGRPGVKTSPIPDSIRLQVDLPERVSDYSSELVPPDSTVLAGLPQDTSFGSRLYKAPDGFQTFLNAVLMGGDRTSLHKPQFCLEGQGWRIDTAADLRTTIQVERPYSYELPVVRLVANREVTLGDGQKSRARGIYVYWYVADGALSASTSGLQRMWWMARDLLRTGVLQRWAYISCFSVCAPGQEEATFDRMKKFIAAAVPEFQLTPASPHSTAQSATPAP